MDSYAAPLALVTVDDPVDGDFASRVLMSAGWRTSMLVGSQESLTHFDSPVALVLVSRLNSAGSDENFGYGVASLARAGRRVPIIGWIDPNSDAPMGAYDDILPKPCSADRVIDALERWRPQPLPEAFDRLRAAFGDAEAMSLLGRFRQLLIEAEAALATDRPHELAHRVAGMAGMLGFSALGQQWLSLSEDEVVDVARLRRATLRAIVAIDHAPVR